MTWSVSSEASTVATGGFALEVAAPVAIGGAAIAGVGALQVSYAVRAPFDTYPGQTQGKIAREPNKAYTPITFGGPRPPVELPPVDPKSLSFWGKMYYYVGHILKALGPYADDINDVLQAR